MEGGKLSMANTLFNYDELSNLSEQERKLALEILKEYSQKGCSEQFNKILYEDYEEIPVDIETFLYEPKYLGRGLVNSEGKMTVFPYWIKTLKKLFPDPLQPSAYNTLALSGAIGIGKSFVATICLLYELYRMMCLKDPYLHYGLQPIDKITFAFLNITLDAAKGVAWSKCQELLQSSDWFMSKGTLSKSDSPQWIPPKGIELICGSKSGHILGRAVYACLDGDTVIRTSNGDTKISDCVDKEIRVFNYTNGDTIETPSCTVKPTMLSDEEYQIELEDGTVIKCTGNHRFLLTNGKYVEAQYLIEGNEIISCSLQCNNAIIKSIKKVHLDSPKVYYDVINAGDEHNFLIRTNDSYIVSHNCFVDEVSFQPTQEIEKQKAKAKAIVNTASVRMQSRFMKGTKNPTLLVLASSKRTENSYMETFIADKRKKDSKTTLVIDEPQWVIRTDKDSKYKFKVAVGNKHLDSEVIPLNASEDMVDTYRKRGFTIMDVPMGYYEAFMDDINTALTDIAGISTTNAFKFISGSRWSETFSDKYINPFTKEVLEIGNAKDDTAQYYDFFDDSKVPSSLRSKPLFIHLDMSLSGDRTGIAGTWIIGKTPHQDGVPDAKELYFQLAFSVAIKAPRGHEVSFEKNRQFIRWLKQKGFCIKGISSDTYQSADLKQTLISEGYNYSTISVDRVNNHVCEPYQYFRSTIYEKRIDTYDTKVLTEEIINLERDSNGKVDHPMGGTVGSKDIADAVCGSVWNASLHAEEFAFDYGETLDTITEVSSSKNGETARRQIAVDFEEELNKIFDPMQRQQSKEKSNEQSHTTTFRDFGMGSAQALQNQYLANGIIII